MLALFYLPLDEIFVFQWLTKMKLEKPHMQVDHVEPDRSYLSLIDVICEGRFPIHTIVM